MQVPLYIEEVRLKRDTEYRVRPLFVREILRRGELVSAVATRVLHDLREAFQKVGELPRHDALLEWSFAPDCTGEFLDRSLLLRHNTVQVRLLIVSFPSPVGDGRIAFSPTLPDYWFDVARGDDLLTRAAEALTDYYKAVEKEQGAHFRVASMQSLVRAWVSTAELHFTPHQKYGKPSGNPLAALMGDEKMSGQRELQRVGRKIDALFPDSLTRAVLRESEVAELSRLLAAGDRRPILLVGPPMVGKTALVHECVFRRRKAMPRPEDPTGSLWLIAPQRLISGMMYSGQWENRLLAILDHMKNNSLVLYLDDLPGFYHAGISAQSSLNAAQVLRPYIERRDIRVVAEITPESLRILQERDRGFVDLFHILPLREPAEPDARRILFSVIRKLEVSHRCRLDIEVLPTVLELQARYVRDLALPGKAAVFLSNLASKFEDVNVERSDVLREFQAKSGLSVGFLDRHTTLDRHDVEKALRENVIGQEDAIQAMTDVVSIAKAQLNDPGRPLGSFLFLGPTGVGKTHAARALAKYLFGSADRLLRFDMNEYLDSFSAQRLVGTWNQPEGLLTSAVRRQPYSVILLDEIEKADPAVFDLLLQVLGEGRLTDTLGRTSDFANTLIIMTSNLGVREAESRFGFAAVTTKDRAAAFRQAAQAFFRPEFYNRIDRIVPFQRLSRLQTREIASGLIANVLEREGLRQRRCMLSVMPAAMERIIDAGYQPDLGARALKRAIERQVTHPVAARLAAIEPGTPTLIDLFPQGNAGIGVQVRALPYADRLALPDVSNHYATIKKIDAALDRLHNSMQHLRPSGRIVVGNISPAHVRYFAMKDQFDKIERLLERFEKGDQRKSAGTRRTPVKIQKTVLKRSRVNFRALLAAHDLRHYMHELAETSEAAGTAGDEGLLGILRELALLEAMEKSSVSRVALILRVVSGALLRAAPLFQFYSRLQWKLHDLSRTLQQRSHDAAGLSSSLAFVLEHAAAEAVGIAEQGVHLCMGDAQQFHPVQVIPLHLEPLDDPVEKIVALMKAEARWQDDMAAGKRAPEDDPLPPGKILRLFDRTIVDLRSGLIAGTGAGRSDGARMENQAMVLAALPLPQELEEEK